ncbi:homeodomain-interacting protein kinase 3-like isoform X1 [Lates japonicus]|uniref:Homeodomain-interacting protein kinase 3-like isoform X1 n=1 Tax=Lates japonicus TaxID=270547 RepID=A0AAD3RN31_LATJO|nr:homeodomain-interacting protein kinase 3-like isoform X1 [Lates japonicus]
MSHLSTRSTTAFWERWLTPGEKAENTRAREGNQSAELDSCRPGQRRQQQRQRQRQRQRQQCVEHMADTTNTHTVEETQEEETGEHTHRQEKHQGDGGHSWSWDITIASSVKSCVELMSIRQGRRSDKEKDVAQATLKRSLTEETSSSTASLANPSVSSEGHLPGLS